MIELSLSSVRCYSSAGVSFVLAGSFPTNPIRCPHSSFIVVEAWGNQSWIVFQYERRNACLPRFQHFVRRAHSTISQPDSSVPTSRPAIKPRREFLARLDRSFGISGCAALCYRSRKTVVPAAVSTACTISAGFDERQYPRQTNIGTRLGKQTSEFYSAEVEISGSDRTRLAAPGSPPVAALGLILHVQSEDDTIEKFWDPRSATMNLLEEKGISFMRNRSSDFLQAWKVEHGFANYFMKRNVFRGQRLMISKKTKLHKVTFFSHLANPS
jgi:hypothetical protein